MTIVLPIKFFILLICTPIKLLSERGKQQRNIAAEVESHKASALFDPSPQQWLSEAVPSVTEHTTVNLGGSGDPKKSLKLETDPLNEDRA